MSRSILLTGGTGLVGRPLLNALAGHEYKITALYRKNKQESGKVKWVYSDFANFDPSLLNDIKDIDIVVHNAACIKSGSTKEEREEIKKINFDATSQLFDWAVEKGVKKIIFTGSLSVVQKPLPDLITEEAETNPLLYYAESKLFAETKLLAMNNQHGMSNIILRISSPVPLSANHLPETVLKKWINNSKEGKNIDVYGSGERTQDFIAVTDIAESFVSSIKKETAKGIFNIASGTSISMNAIAKHITGRFKNRINNTGLDINDHDRWNISIEKAKNILNFRPAYSSEENIKNILATII